MRRKSIAIVSSDLEIASFFELEAIACGCETSVYSVPPEEVSSYDLVVLDLASGTALRSQAPAKLRL